MAVVLNLDRGSVAAESVKRKKAAWEAATQPCEARDLSGRQRTSRCSDAMRRYRRDAAADVELGLLATGQHGRGAEPGLRICRG